MTYNTQFTGLTAKLSLRFAATALLGVAMFLLHSTSVQAQWTTPDGSGNISNTNTGNVGIGVGASAPGVKLDVKRTDGSDLVVRAWNAATASGAAIFRATASSNRNGVRIPRACESRRRPGWMSVCAMRASSRAC